jgi:hypothetical protein
LRFESIYSEEEEEEEEEEEWIPASQYSITMMG